MGYKIHFDVDADYLWVYPVGKVLPPFTIDEKPGLYKVIGYKKKNGVYSSLGAAVFRIALSDGKNKPLSALSVPRDGLFGWGKPTAVTPISISVALPYVVQNEIDTFEALAERAIALAPGNIVYDWDYPFRMSGNYGIRHVSRVSPFNGAAVDEENIYYRLGAAGYLNTWAVEDVNDIAPVWASDGEGKDCEDFAVAVASAIVEYAPHLTWYIIFGTVKKTINHAWVVVFEKNKSGIIIEPTHRYIETYTPSSIYNGTLAFTEKETFTISDYHAFMKDGSGLISLTPADTTDYDILASFPIPPPKKSSAPYPWMTH